MSDSRSFGAHASFEPHHGDTLTLAPRSEARPRTTGRRLQSQTSGCLGRYGPAVTPWWILNQTGPNTGRRRDRGRHVRHGGAVLAVRAARPALTARRGRRRAGVPDLRVIDVTLPGRHAGRQGIPRSRLPRHIAGHRSRASIGPRNGRSHGALPPESLGYGFHMNAQRFSQSLAVTPPPRRVPRAPPPSAGSGRSSSRPRPTRRSTFERHERHGGTLPTCRPRSRRASSGGRPPRR